MEIAATATLPGRWPTDAPGRPLASAGASTGTQTRQYTPVDSASLSGSVPTRPDPPAPETVPRAAAPSTPGVSSGPNGTLFLETATPLRDHLQAVAESLRRGTLGPNGYVFGERAGGSRLDVDGLRDCAGFTMRLSRAGAEDAMVAAGVALATGRPSVYLVESRKELPWFLREADQCFPGQVAIVEGPAPSLDGVELAAAPRPPAGPPLDTFVGCLMSGLSEAQYQEGKNHLQAIDDTLRQRMGSADNFCEGLRIASTSAFDTPRVGLMNDVDAVRRSQRCVFYLYDDQPRPSGMWVEVGLAVGLGKPCTLLVPDLGALPPCLQGELPRGVRVHVYGDHASLMRSLSENPGAPLAPPR